MIANFQITEFEGRKARRPVCISPSFGKPWITQELDVLFASASSSAQEQAQLWALSALISITSSETLIRWLLSNLCETGQHDWNRLWWKDISHRSSLWIYSAYFILFSTSKKLRATSCSKTLKRWLWNISTTNRSPAHQKNHQQLQPSQHQSHQCALEDAPALTNMFSS